MSKSPTLTVSFILGEISYSSVVRFEDIEFAMLKRITPPKKAPKARYIINIFHRFCE